MTTGARDKPGETGKYGRSKLDPVAHSLALDAFGGSLPPGHNLYLEGTPQMLRSILLLLVCFALVVWALLCGASDADELLYDECEPLGGRFSEQETEYDAYVGMN